MRLSRLKWWLGNGFRRLLPEALCQRATRIRSEFFGHDTPDLPMEPDFEFTRIGAADPVARDLALIPLDVHDRATAGAQAGHFANRPGLGQGRQQMDFSGLIFVDEGAHRTDAYQTCRNLLMSDEAEANSMPGLEINADDVKCSHGSTSAQISDDEIFYLRARGICPQRARQLIARGFSVEVVERLGNEPCQELVLAFIDDKFAHILGGGA